MAIISAWREAADPAILFLHFWVFVLERPTDQLVRERKAGAAILRAFAEAVGSSSPAEAVSRICDQIERGWGTDERFPTQRARAGLVLAAMRAIDEALLRIHPRSIAPPPKAGSPLPDWLADAREKRTLSGSFATDDRFQLIARGPFGRSPRLPLQEPTFLLRDQFAAVSVVEPDLMRQDGRKLRVVLKVIGHSADRGVTPRPGRAGSEMITFVPLAEDEADLEMVVQDEDGVALVDYVKGPKFNPRPAFEAAVEGSPECDILMAPELTVDHDDISSFSALLGARSSDSPRLVVAGSALTPRGPDLLPWNEAFILNGNGAILWTHRKVEAYGMLEGTSEGLKDPRVKGIAQLIDRISWSDEIVVADIEALGRCLVLICQDFMMEVVPSLLMEYRPDWVLVPILDSGTSLDRWPAGRAKDLSGFSEARFVIVSSLTMKHWLKKKYPGTKMGVAIGPKRINHGDVALDAGGAAAEISPKSTAKRYGTLQWRSLRGWKTPSHPKKL